MIRKSFLLKIYDAANMQRWNDKIRPVELRELDKQAHKMVFAFVLGKLNENERGFDWIKIIEGGIFEFLQRLVVTDIKPQIFHKIKGDPEKLRQLNDWVFRQLKPIISPIGNNFSERFVEYFSSYDEDINKKILGASHFLSTKWEFGIIEWANPGGYEIESIRKELEERSKKF
jgi:putative hydrolase of HD superfamily